MPTFIAYKKGEPIKTVTGAKPAELKVSNAPATSVLCKRAQADASSIILGEQAAVEACAAVAN